MYLGFNTNGLTDHDLPGAIDVLRSIGYDAVALTIDHGKLNPYDPAFRQQLSELGPLLRKSFASIVLETGARYLLDPHHKHEPTLVSPGPGDRQRRIDFLRRAVDLATHLEANCVSLWSGVVRDGSAEETAWQRLTSSLQPVVEYAGEHGVVLAFEPEPEMLVATLGDYDQLLGRLQNGGIDTTPLQLTMDVGHVHCQDEGSIPDAIRHWQGRLANIHLEDMRARIHEHLMFGEGEIDFPPIFAALAEIGYGGPVNVELSRHSHEGPVAAQQAFDFLRPLVDTVHTSPPTMRP